MKCSDRVNNVTIHLCYEILSLILFPSLLPLAAAMVIVIIVLIVHLVIIFQAPAPLVSAGGRGTGRQVAASLALAAVNAEVDKAGIDLQLRLGLLLCLLHGDYDDAVALCVLMTTHVPHIVFSWVVVLLHTYCGLPPKRPFSGRTPLVRISSAISSQVMTQALLSRYLLHIIFLRISLVLEQVAQCHINELPSFAICTLYLPFLIVPWIQIATSA
jgi:hypothetical protein